MFCFFNVQLKPEKCSGGNISKARISGLAAANAAGKKLPMLVIGKAKNPRCFKNIQALPYRYRLQKKSWMDSVLFEDYVRELNAEGKCAGKLNAAKEGKCALITVLHIMRISY